MTTWTLIDEQRPVAVDVDSDGVFDPLVLGWQRKPEGLCRDEVCIPVPSSTALTIENVAALLGRPLVTDASERVAAIGASATDRANVIRSGKAPDFELPDINGERHRLSDHLGRKVVLYAYASW
jgi:AhpC/TSA family